MAEAVEAALAERGARLLVEAPTGTGKSLAYLTAAALARRSSGEGMRVVVATGTRALQDQLAHHDAPLLVQALRRCGLQPPAVELVKGRRNYLCRLRLARWQPPLGLDAVTRRHVDEIRRWVDTTLVGDRSELSSLPDDSLTWNELDADADACLGQVCVHHAECFITLLRQRARQAHIIITNHHLLCADLRLRFAEGAAEARVLPPYDALIVDEAHKLPHVAAEHFGLSLGPARVDALCRDALRVPSGERAVALRGAIMALAHAGGALFSSLGQALGSAADGARVSFKTPDHSPVAEAAERMLVALQGADGQLGAHSALHAGALNECEALQKRTKSLEGDLEYLKAANDERFAFCADRRGSRGRLSAYPADVAALLANTMLRGSETVVLTSATLAVNGDFSNYQADVGLDDQPQVRAVSLPTTFEAHQAALYVPRDLPDPDAPAFAERAAQRMGELLMLTDGGAFVLCTTHRAMNGYAAMLRAAMSDLCVLRQGEAPKAALLERFKRDGSAVLVATHSFWEGVDVRGQALRLVIVDKLPFAPPSDPLVAARAARAARAGRDPFRDVQLSDAILTLRQGLGRLLRSRDDRGLCVVLDGRLWRRGYGATVRAALGGHPMVSDWPDVLLHAKRLGLSRG
jgi:ATP-dependent DNA helicase DinG